MSNNVCPFMAAERMRQAYLGGLPCPEREEAEAAYERLAQISRQILDHGLCEFPGLAHEYGRRLTIYMQAAWRAFQAANMEGKSK